MLHLSELPSDDRIVDAYLRRERWPDSTADDEPWAIDAFRTMIVRDPPRAWRLIRRLIEVAPKEMLGSIGTGELEEFVSRHAADYIKEIEQAAKESDGFVDSLANVWITRGAFEPAIEQRLVTASRGTIDVLDEGPEIPGP